MNIKGIIKSQYQASFEMLKQVTKLELQLYNIRHLQLHTGELCERLGAATGLEVDWVGMGS